MAATVGLARLTRRWVQSGALDRYVAAVDHHGRYDIQYPFGQGDDQRAWPFVCGNSPVDGRRVIAAVIGDDGMAAVLRLHGHGRTGFAFEDMEVGHAHDMLGYQQDPEENHVE